MKAGLQTAVVATLAFAAAPGAAGAEVSDSSAVMEKIADGVYAIIHKDATDQWPHGNTGVIVYEDGVFVIDSNYLPSRARADIKLIRKVTKKPVKYLSTTHWHFDHNNGAIAYREAYPGLVVLYERETDKFIDVNTTWWPKMSTAEGSARLKSNDDLAAAITSGKNSEGKTLTDAERRDFPKYLEQRRAEIAELKALKTVTADETFEGALTLKLGSRTLVIEDRGKANSPHDVTFYLPDEKILFAGDIIVQSPLPYTGASWPVPWVAVLKDLEATPVSALVPGHGPVMRDHAYTKKLRETFETVLERVEALVRQGRTLDQIQAEIDLGDLRANYLIWSENVSDDDWKTVTSVLVERAFRGVRGQG